MNTLIRLIGTWVSIAFERFWVRIEKADPSRPVRLTRFNIAFAPLIFSALALAIACLFTFTERSEKVGVPTMQELLITWLVCGGIAAIGILATGFQFHTLVIGSDFKLKRFFGDRSYSRDDLDWWKLELRGNSTAETSQQPIDYVMFVFKDKRYFERAISRRVSVAIQGWMNLPNTSILNTSEATTSPR